MPLFHLGGTLGPKVPFWDSRDEFGDTNLLVRTPEEGASMTRALGPYAMVLLRRHGATVVGKSVRECVFRSIYTTRNAELQLRAMAIGTPGPLSPGETEKSGGHNLGGRGVERAWEYWTIRLMKAEAMWAAAGLPRLKGLMEAARPAGAGLPAAKRGKPPRRRRSRRKRSSPNEVRQGQVRQRRRSAGGEGSRAALRGLPQSRKRLQGTVRHEAWPGDRSG